MITVTRADAPKVEDFLVLVRQIFASRQFTNHGPMVVRFEQALESYLCAEASSPCFVSTCNNGTSAITLALNALDIKGKRVITSSFTYVATLSAILAAGCVPLLVDIDPDTLCLTPDAAAQAAHTNVGAVLPVHIYGNACDVEGFDALARTTGLPVVYDAAHAFGARYAGQALLSFGDCAASSFHATKVMHTCEGGCVVSHCEDMRGKLSLIRAFGHVNDTHVMAGGNAKMSELHAAMGLCLLPRVPQGIASRKVLSDTYDTLLAPLPLQRPAWREGLQRNYAYYPVIFESETALLAAQRALQAQDIVPRRYFYPALTALPYVQEAWKRPCPVADSVSHRILCLPLYGDMTEMDVRRISNILLDVAP